MGEGEECMSRGKPLGGSIGSLGCGRGVSVHEIEESLLLNSSIVSIESPTQSLKLTEVTELGYPAESGLGFPSKYSSCAQV
jgi:hypothetical protein